MFVIAAIFLQFARNCLPASLLVPEVERLAHRLLELLIVHLTAEAADHVRVLPHEIAKLRLFVVDGVIDRVRHDLSVTTLAAGRQAGQRLLETLLKLEVRRALIESMRDPARVTDVRLETSGLDQQPIPLKLLLPALEGAALEEDDDLTMRWAGLLATAATSGQTLPAYADILRQLTPEEARMLDYIYDRSEPVLDDDTGVDKQALQEESGLAHQEFLVRVQNLHRLELIVQLTTGGLEPVRGFRGWGHLGEVGLTALGEAFVLACRGPGKLIEARDDA